MLKFILFILITISTSQAQVRGSFQQGTQEVGVTNLGIGYSTNNGLMGSLGARYQYYFLNQFSLGASAFYQQINEEEWMGLGPVASYIFFIHDQWFSRLDQQVIAARFNGFDEHMSDLYGISAISFNYLPMQSRFYIGLGYAMNYPLRKGEILSANSLQINLGWLLN